jgi:ketosteroid isomerase-like protein
MDVTSDAVIARLEQVEAVQAITKLKHTYWHFNDVGLLGDKIAPLFTEDGVWSNEELGHYEGREAIRAFFNGASNALPFCAHVGMNEIINVDGDTATGKWRCLLTGTFVEDGRKTSRLILIDYRDDFVRLDGRWFIKKLDILFNFNVEVTPGWAGAEKVRSAAE